MYREYIMSQSDYIKHKRLSSVLKEVNKLSPTLDSQQYTSYKEYSLENNVTSAKNVYYKFIPQGTQFVYGMVIRNAGNCTDMVFCKGTNGRENRKMNNIDGIRFQPKVMRPLSLKTLKEQHSPKVSILDNVNCKCASV